MFFILMNSCNRIEGYPYDKDGFTYKDKFIFDHQFRMSGIYITQDRGKNYYGINYFFQNGLYYNAGMDNTDLNKICFLIKEREDPRYWGYFIVEKNILKIQVLFLTSLERYNEYKVEERFAKIINDSTIHFYKKITPYNKEIELNETFHFRYCENKPDSTNVLMK
jgi:hypothetical protein